MCCLVKIKPHGGFVDLDNSFNDLWKALSEAGDLHLKTEKKKTHFIARASTCTSEDSNERKKAIVFLRRVHERGRLEEAATCLECCWGFYYTCDRQRIGMYCKVLDKWASSHAEARSDL